MEPIAFGSKKGRDCPSQWEPSCVEHLANHPFAVRLTTYGHKMGATPLTTGKTPHPNGQRVAQTLLGFEIWLSLNHGWVTGTLLHRLRDALMESVNGTPLVHAAAYRSGCALYLGRL